MNTNKIRNFNRRDFLKAMGIGTVVMSMPRIVFSSEKIQKPNILWIVAEDLSPDLGCYGNKLVKTPNIDKLASEGVRFTNAFVSAPVCSTARSAIWTGMYQTSVGIHHHTTNPPIELPNPVKVLTEYFRAAGYFTTNCGKGRKEIWDMDEYFSTPGKTHWNFKANEAYDGTDWRQRKPGQPFFAQVNIHETHRWFNMDPENPIDPDNVKLPPYYPDHPISRRDWASYLECAQVLDWKVGKILKRLDDDGLANNTIVVFFGDHGRDYPRGKWTLYEGGIRIPLIIRWPWHLKLGTVADDLVSAIDLGPTCMNLVDIEVPDHMNGQPFLGPNAEKREYIVAARDRCDDTYDHVRCIRTKRFKYIRNFLPELPLLQPGDQNTFAGPMATLMKVLHAQGKLTPQQKRLLARSRPEEELYDLQNDPHELVNLAGNPRYQTTLNELRSTLDRWIKETGDKGVVPEAPEVVAEVVRRYQYHLVRNLKDRGLSLDSTPEEILAWWEKEVNRRRYQKIKKK